MKSDDKDRKTNCEPPLPDSSFPESIDDPSVTLVTPSGYQGGDDFVEIICDIHEIEPFEGDINDLIASKIKQVIEEWFDYEPKQQTYPEHILIEEIEEFSLINLIKIIDETKRLGNISGLLSLAKNIASDNNSILPKQQHEYLSVPYGPALLAVLSEDVTINNFSLHLHSSAGVRLLAARCSRSSDLLDYLSYDECVLVRGEVVKNEFSQRSTIDRLAGTVLISDFDPFVYVRSLIKSEVLGKYSIIKNTDSMDTDLVGGQSLVYDLELSECVCTKTEINENFNDFFQEQNLDLPIIAAFFEEKITNFGFWNWSTLPYPSRMQDYMMESVEYLKGPIPDQYSLNHSGHGLNSYSLNFRCAIGNIAIFAQVGWVGAHMDSKEKLNQWDEIQVRLSSLILRNGDWESNQIKIRKFLIIFSDFRITDGPQLWEHKNNKWIQVGKIQSWEGVLEYLNQNNAVDSEYKKIYVEPLDK